MGTPISTSSEVNPPTGLSQDFIDQLQETYKIAGRRYKESGKAATKAHVEYALAKDWKSDLETYKDLVETTYEQINELDKFLLFFLGQIDVVCDNIKLGNEAVEILVNSLKCLSEEVETLRGMTKALFDALECINDPVLDPNVSIMMYMVALQEKLKESITCGLDAIDKVLGLFQLILKIEFLVCDKPEATDEKDSQGLASDLKNLQYLLCSSFCGGFPAEANDAWCEVGTADGSIDLSACCSTEAKGAVELDCMSDFDKPALCDEKGAYLSGFYIRLTNKLENAVLLENYKKCLWETYNEQLQKSLSKQTAIKAALDAALAAKAKCN